MKARQELSKEQKLQISKERFEEGKSTNELAGKYNVCQRTIIRISNKYREFGDAAFDVKQRKEHKENLEEKIERLEKKMNYCECCKKNYCHTQKKSNF